MHALLNENNIVSHPPPRFLKGRVEKFENARNYQRGGNLKKGEVNFERGSDSLGNYGQANQASFVHGRAFLVFSPLDESNLEKQLFLYVNPSFHS